MRERGDSKQVIDHFIESILGVQREIAGAGSPHFPESQVVEAFYYIIESLGSGLEGNPDIGLRQVLEMMQTLVQPLPGQRVSPTAYPRYCSACGTSNEAGARFCQSCGMRQS